jgi:S-adenosylmethionine hydrolase
MEMQLPHWAWVSAQWLKSQRSDEMRPIITLTTDFGLSDYDTGVLYGVIWRIAPEARVVDLTHDIPRHDVQAAALLLERCTPFFPSGTIHVVVVDPGVGTGRRGLAARLGEACFVGPDNGCLTFMLQRTWQAAQPVEIVHLDQPRYWLEDVSAIFHGRDVFAPVAAYLAGGVTLSQLGSPIDDPILLDLPGPQFVQARSEEGSGWRGAVIHIDAFGNLTINLRPQHLAQSWSEAQIDALEVRIGATVIRGLARTFGDGKPEQLLALFDSSGYLSICVVNGSAADRLGARLGDEVVVTLARASKAGINDPGYRE